jgi:hypothetical protein
MSYHLLSALFPAVLSPKLRGPGVYDSHREFLRRGSRSPDQAPGAHCARAGITLEPDDGPMRQTAMKSLSCRTPATWAAIAATALSALAAAGCSNSPAGARSTVPPAFRAACGHPGVKVTARKVPETIAHADCDLTGVTISYPGRGGATVPRISGTIGTSSGLTLTVHPGTLDVTVNATGAPGNA